MHARVEVMEQETVYLKEEHARTVTQLQQELHVAKSHAESAIDELDAMDAHHTTAIEVLKQDHAKTMRLTSLQHVAEETVRMTDVVTSHTNTTTQLRVSLREEHKAALQIAVAQATGDAEKVARNAASVELEARVERAHTDAVRRATEEAERRARTESEAEHAVAVDTMQKEHQLSLRRHSSFVSDRVHRKTLETWKREAESAGEKDESRIGGVLVSAHLVFKYDTILTTRVITLTVLVTFSY